MDNKIKTFRELKRASRLELPAVPPIKVALLGDTATQLLSVAIKGCAALYGIGLDIFESDYNQVERQVLDPASELHSFDARYTVVFQSTHKLLETYYKADMSGRRSLAEDRIAFLRTLCGAVKGKVVYYNYPEIDDEVFGSYGNKTDLSFIFQLRKLNYELMKLSESTPNLYICDISSIQNTIGRKAMFDAAVYVSTEMVLSLDALPLVASRTVDIIRSIEGQFKKCLILDLDNTVWGGIVGDDGWEGIQVGHDIGIGKVFSEFQQWVKKLRDRGIIICVCSKNDEKTAKEPFEKNPEMILSLDDISVFIANWNNKADNIRKIQKILNIGFDSMVFLDDNPFERNMVRSNIEGISVPELPEDPADYLEFLYSQNLFETASYSSADKDRTKQYQTEARRLASAEMFTDESEFLKSLKMESEVSDFNRFNTPRVAQLSQRSNQFNLRTVRYTEDEIEAISKNPDEKGFAFTLTDKFGDNGLISVVILKTSAPETMFIDTWFMSCRVLKRGMEHFVLNTIVEWARQNGYTRLEGEYIPTAKNSMVSGFYRDLGFSDNGGEEGRTSWILDLGSFNPRECFISLKK